MELLVSYLQDLLDPLDLRDFRVLKDLLDDPGHLAPPVAEDLQDL